MGSIHNFDFSKKLDYLVLVNKNIALISTLVVVLILLAIIGYFIFQNQRLIGKLTKETPYRTIISSPTIQPTPTPFPSPVPKLTYDQVAENMAAAVNSKNGQALASFMTTPKVNFTLMSTECCQPLTPDEAADQMSYIKEGIPMDFNQANPTIVNLKSRNSQLTDTFIGLSKNNEHLAAFTLDSENRISAIQLSISWKLYNY